MYCIKCGKEIPDAGAPMYCPQCGVAQMSQPAVPVKKTSTAVILLIVLVVVSVPVTGIIAAIAIPQFAAYRIKGSNSSALADLKNIKTACEGYYADNKRYPDSLSQIQFVASPGVEVLYQPDPDRKGYLVTTIHRTGDRKYGAASEKTEIFYHHKSETDDSFRPL
jgi:type IV pilus assembly protein PilA